MIVFLKNENVNIPTCNVFKFLSLKLCKVVWRSWCNPASIFKSYYTILIHPRTSTMKLMHIAWLSSPTPLNWFYDAWIIIAWNSIFYTWWLSYVTDILCSLDILSMNKDLINHLHILELFLPVSFLALLQKSLSSVYNGNQIKLSCWRTFKNC